MAAKIILQSLSAMVDILRKIPLFRDVPQETIENIARKSRILKFDAGAWLILEGTEDDTVYIILSGNVQVVRKPSPGTNRHIYLAYGGKYEILGEIRLLDQKPHNAGVETLTECSVVDIHVPTLRECMRLSAQLNMNIAKEISNKLETNGLQIEILRQKENGHRLIKLLCIFAAKFGQGAGNRCVIQEAIGREHLAAIIDVDPEEVSRMLTQLKERGVLNYRYRFGLIKIDILNLEGLHHLQAVKWFQRRVQKRRTPADTTNL